LRAKLGRFFMAAGMNPSAVAAQAIVRKGQPLSRCSTDRESGFYINQAVFGFKRCNAMPANGLRQTAVCAGTTQYWCREAKLLLS
jgi:hypothetical protein